MWESERNYSLTAYRILRTYLIYIYIHKQSIEYCESPIISKREKLL
jgi:hypothetical protein